MKKEQHGYAPVSPKGEIWTEWIRESKYNVKGDLDNHFAGWDEEGFKIKRVKITVKEKTK